MLSVRGASSPRNPVAFRQPGQLARKRRPRTRVPPSGGALARAAHRVWTHACDARSCAPRAAAVVPVRPPGGVAPRGSRPSPLVRAPRSLPAAGEPERRAGPRWTHASRQGSPNNNNPRAFTSWRALLLRALTAAPVSASALARAGAAAVASAPAAAAPRAARWNGRDSLLLIAGTHAAPAPPTTLWRGGGGGGAGVARMRTR